MQQRISIAGILTTPRPLVGMVHLAPLPGSPRWEGSMAAVVDRAVADAAALRDAGFDGLLIENFGDTPFHPGTVAVETVAAMAVVVTEVMRDCGLPVGVNVLRNDAAAALGICAATGADFLRVNVHVGAMITDQGWIEGDAHRTLRSRRALALGCAILADVMVKHATPPPGLGLAAAARDTWDRGLADVLVVSGPATGHPASPDAILEVRDAAPDAPVWIGSGLDPLNAHALISLADGAIVGSAVQRGGRAGAGVDSVRARRWVDAARASH